MPDYYNVNYVLNFDKRENLLKVTILSEDKSRNIAEYVCFPLNTKATDEGVSFLSSDADFEFLFYPEKLTFVVTDTKNKKRIRLINDNLLPAEIMSLESRVRGFDEPSKDELIHKDHSVGGAKAYFERI